MPDTATPSTMAAWSRRIGLAWILLPVILLVWMRQGQDLAAWSGWLGAAIPLLIAAIAQAQVVLAGGQGLGAGSAALFVNALLAVGMSGTLASMVGWSLAGPVIGGLIGACNGAIIGYGRISSTAVTLASGIITGGLTFALLDEPAPILPEDFRSMVTGMPAAVIMVGILLMLAMLLDRSRIGQAIRAAGAGPVAARKPSVVLLAYALAGTGYGLSGVFLSAELGTADPFLGAPSLLEIYAAVTLGGSIPHLRQGSTLGAALGALSVSCLVNLMLPLGLDDRVVPALDGLLLALAIGAASLGPRAGALPPIMTPRSSRISSGMLAWGTLAVLLPWLVLRGASPVSNDLLIAAIVVGTLALAQAVVMRSGSLDLSLPSIVGLAGLGTVSLLQGSSPATFWVVPLVLLGGALVGAVTGGLGSRAGAGRILLSLAMAGMLQSAAVALTFARPTGFASPPLSHFMANRPDGPAFAVLVVGPALVFAILWFGKRTRSPSPVFAHMAAAVLAAATGIMLAGYGTEFRVGIADTLTAPSLLALALAGLAIGVPGGNGIALIAAAPAVIALDTLLVGWPLGYPARQIIIGAALLAATIAVAWAQRGASSTRNPDQIS